MMTTPGFEGFLVDAWKRQLDVGLQVFEAMLEGAGKARESQLAAAVETHAALAATRKSLAQARSLQEVARVQLEWLTQNAGRVAAYWASLGTVGRETQERVAGCLCGPDQVKTWLDSAREHGNVAPALGPAMESAWKSWLDALGTLQAPAPKAAKKQPA